MKKENAKPGFFERLTIKNKTKKSSCCCSFELEEIPEEEKDKKCIKKEENENPSCN